MEISYFKQMENWNRKELSILAVALYVSIAWFGAKNAHAMDDSGSHPIQNHQHHNPKSIAASEMGMKWMEAANAKIGEKVDGNLRFINQDGKQKKLGDYFDKPLLVNFIFADCPSVCPTVCATLGKAASIAKKRYAGKFRVLTISFDPGRDNAKRMKEYGEAFTDDFSYWSFGVSEKGNAKDLTSAFGFTFVSDKDLIWSHIAMVTVVDGGGLIVDQLFGVQVDEQMLMTTLEAIYER